MINESLNLEIWERLIQDKSLDGLALESRDGRIDLRGLNWPEPAVLRRFRFHDREIAEVDTGIIQGPKWKNLDFSGSKLGGLRLMRGHLENCRFDGCNLQGVRVWATVFSNVSFKGANLRGSVLGGVHDGVRNAFVAVDFSEANLGNTIYKAAAFEHCTFCDTKLTKIDFQSSTFKDCRFEGVLDDVLFYRHGFQGEQFPANEMIDVDFSHAALHDVGFRGLTLDRVKLPNDADHILLKDVPTTLNKFFAELERQGDSTARQLAAFLNIGRKWVAPNQAQAVINVQDMAETIGAAGVERLRGLMRQYGEPK